MTPRSHCILVLYIVLNNPRNRYILRRVRLPCSLAPSISGQPEIGNRVSSVRQSIIRPIFPAHSRIKECWLNAFPCDSRWNARLCVNQYVNVLTSFSSALAASHKMPPNKERRYENDHVNFIRCTGERAAEQCTFNAWWGLLFPIVPLGVVHL
jgi:hypothetical protein